MRVEGRALHGLDEFMLRLGHLTVLCQAAVTAGGSAHRFTKTAEKKLTEFVPVAESDLDNVIRYLRAKRLCPEENDDPADDDRLEFRYPDLRLAKKDGLYALEATGSGVRIMWQDLCLAAEGVRSRVGAITIQAKRGSKTGLSHIIDWATSLELINSSGLPAARGQLLAKFRSASKQNPDNPYILGNERLIFAELLLGGDADVFFALAHSLGREKGPIKKREATQHYVDAIQKIVEAAEKARNLSNRQRHSLFALWRDLRRGAKGEVLAGTSTAWHRAASRFETYVDLGLLRKGDGDESERYEYKYYISDAIRHARDTLAQSPDSEMWVRDHLADVLLGTTCSAAPIAASELIRFLPHIMQPLARPTAPLPIDTLAAGLVWLCADLGHPITFGAARRSLEELATGHPDIARLSTGSTSRPEYISISRSLGDRNRGPAAI